MNTSIASRTIWPWVIGIQALAFVASVLYCLYPFPFLDQIDWLISYFHNGLGSVFLPHNGHRLIIPRLLLIADLEIFNGKTIIGTTMGLAALAGLAAILAQTSRDAMEKFGN